MTQQEADFEIKNVLGEYLRNEGNSVSGDNFSALIKNLVSIRSQWIEKTVAPYLQNCGLSVSEDAELKTPHLPPIPKAVEPKERVNPKGKVIDGRYYNTPYMGKYINKRDAVFQKRGGKCYLCGVKIEKHRNFTIDHIVPLSKGGSGFFENLEPCCTTCNYGKGDKILISQEEIKPNMMAKKQKEQPISKAQPINNMTRKNKPSWGDMLNL